MKKLWLIVPLFIWACQDQQSIPSITKQQPDTLPSIIDSNQPVPSKDSTLAKQRQLQGFKTIPSQVDGCSGLFKVASCKKDCSFIFAIDLQGKAFIQVNNKLIALARQRKMTTAGSFHEVYTTEHYTVEIELKEVRQLGEELIKYEGVIKLSSEGALQEYAVVGEIGC